MRVKKRPTLKLLSVMMCATLLMPFASTKTFAATDKNSASNSGVKTSLHSGATVDTQSKISSRLKDQFSKDKYVTFLIKLKDQADTKEAAKKAARLAKKEKMTSAKAEYTKRSAVVNALRAKANETQVDLTKFLASEKKTGSVKSYESFYIVNGMALTATKEVMNKLASFSEVEKILPNETRHLNPVVTDAKASTSKAKAKSKTTDSGNVEWNIDRVGGPAVWNMGIDGSGVVIGSLDSGVQWDHPALKDKYRGYDPTNPNQPNNEYNWFDAVSGQSMPYDDLGHGTHTMGTMLGQTPDRSIGMAPGAKWISARAFTAAGTGSDMDILEAGEWLLAPKDANGNPHPEMAPDVINNSWGGGPGLDEWFRPMVQNWRAAGIFPTFSAGNVDLNNPGGPGSVANPANYPEAFAVGATDNQDHLAGFSLRGPSPYDEIKPEVAAPGVNICSSVPGSQYDCTYSGTSMAAPLVSGTVALMLSADSSLTVDQIEQTLMDTATPETDSEYPESPNNGYGHGLLDAFSAVSAVTDGLGRVEGQVLTEGEDNVAPTFQHQAPSETYVGLDLPLQVAVQDNVSITKVELLYKTSGDWKTISADQVDGDYKNAVFQVTIPGEDITGSTLQYKWHIVDFGQNDVTSEVYNVDVHPAITDGYTQDFESTPAGWQSYGDNNTWEWGVPTSGPGSAFSGDKVYATNLDGTYDSNSDATLMMPPVQVSDEGSYLQFKHWFELENNYDNAQVFISTDQEHWQTLAAYTGTSDGWQDGEIDLLKYAGQRVFIAFHLQSDVSVQKAGWYLDDVKLSATPLHSDTEPPTYQHDPITETYVGMNVPLSINVQDNVSVNFVDLEYLVAGSSDWQSVPAALTSGDNTDGVYQAKIPGDAVQEPSVTYRWRITDYGHNTVTSDPYEVTVHPALTVGYSTDFESAPAGWGSSGANDPWQWGVPTSGPNQAASGEKVYATNLSGNYANNTDAYLYMPTVDLTDVSQAALQFKNWYSTENHWDDAEVLVSTDQTNWDKLAEFTGESNGYQDTVLDLSPYAGHLVYIAFHFDSDGSNMAPGWYIDDVGITANTAGSTKASLSVQKDSKIAVKKKDVKKSIDLSKITPGKPKNVKAPVSLSVKTDAVVQSLPLSATVSVLETGRSVNTNPADGSYSLLHAAGTYTLKAETYGYQSATQTVDITKDGVSTANFSLTPIPQGTLSGVVTNKATGEPVEGATVMLMEDANIQPVKTDENGAFSVTAYEGAYTMHVSAPNFHTEDVSVTVAANDTVTQNVELRPFIGYPGELTYDDGTPENAHAFYDADNAWAVKMSLPEGHDSAMVSAGKFLFWTADWPNPGGTDFQVEIYDASGPDGAPGKKLAGPINATAKRDGSWTTVDLSGAGVVVNGDFYIVYVQSKADPNAPGLATDESGQNYGRSWQRVSGAWSASPEDEGNYMIRAVVDYEVTPPVITSPKNGTFTNQDTVTVEGTAAPSTTVTILNNGEAAATVPVGDDGKFSHDITLGAGENMITATASTDSGTTEPSQPVKVVLDQDKPALSISSPADGTKTNHETVTVQGTVSDDNLDSVTVNGQAADVKDDGSYSKRIMLDEGDNVIKVVAKDKAGNEENKQVTVKAKFTAPTITNLKPTEDTYLDAGQTVKVEFDSEPGLDAAFVIQMPLTNLTNHATVADVNELPMTETSSGHYVGYYTATSNVKADGAQIEVRASDDYGNETRQTAGGKLFLNIPNDKPVAEFDAPNKPKRNQDLTFDASGSHDPDGQIVKYEWNFGDGSTAEGVTVHHKYNKGKYTVKLTVTDNRGATTTVTQSIHVR